MIAFGKAALVAIGVIEAAIPILMLGWPELIARLLP